MTRVILPALLLSSLLLPAAASAQLPAGKEDYPSSTSASDGSSQALVIGLFVALAVAGGVVLILRTSRTTSPGDTHRSGTTSSGDSPSRPQTTSPSSTTLAPAVNASKIFISYRRDDSADVAGRIYDKLVDRFGAEQVFKDVDSIPIGVDFRKHLQRHVAGCDVLLAIIGDRWLSAGGATRRLDDEKDFVRIEIEEALRRDIPVVPVLVRGATMPAEGDLPPTLGSLAFRNAIAVRPDPDFRHDIERLMQGIERHS